MEEKGELPEDHDIITEGKASIIFPKANKVFYNKVQVFNRDLSILAITCFAEIYQKEKEETERKRTEKFIAKQKLLEEKAKNDGKQFAAKEVRDYTFPGISIFEALSASGLRSIRYWKEIPNVKHIMTNDLDPEAVKCITKNMKYNKIPVDKVTPNEGDANVVMMQHSTQKKLFDVVDLDPYGTAAVFLHAAVQAVEEGGLLCITCTDKAVLCGNNSETCYGKYGSMPLRGPFCHEQALRILLSLTERTANLSRRYIVPLVSMSIDFYVRVFVRVYTSPAQVKRSASKQSMVFQCIGCGSFTTSALGKVTEKGPSIKFTPGMGPSTDHLCAECKRPFKMGGPIYTGQLHDSEFVEKLLERLNANKADFASYGRINGLLSVIKDELDVPLCHEVAPMCHTLKCTTPTAVRVRSALLNAGYRISQTHTTPKGIKTDAPMDVLWDILRGHIKECPVKKAPNENSPAFDILAKQPKLIADFTYRKEAETSVKKTGVAKFLSNPGANWGPGARANQQQKRKSGNTMHEDLAERSRENQNRKKKKKTEPSKEENEDASKPTEEKDSGN